MMERLSRYILIMVTIIASSVAIPKLYWTIFEKPDRSPFIMYSCINQEFMIRRAGAGITWNDSKGNSYTRNEFEARLPLMYSYQLANTGILPDTINGAEMDLRDIRRARSTFKYQPSDLHSPQPGLYPMFESESDRVKFEIPPDFFRINDRMEFVDAKTNRIDEKKSQKFTYFLNKKGFEFPAKYIAGLATIKKSCDEGYFVIDSSDKLFHVKMIESTPYVKKVDLPDSLQFKYISCVDFSDKYYYGYFISENNDIYVLIQDEYELVRFPVSGFDADKHRLRIFGDMFHYHVIIDGANYTKAFALDKEYQYVDMYEEARGNDLEQIERRASEYIFPFEISLENENSSFVNFYFSFTKVYWWTIVSAVLMIIQILIFSRRKVLLPDQIVDLLIVFCTGVFGFIAVNVFQNKFYR